MLLLPVSLGFLVLGQLLLLHLLIPRLVAIFFLHSLALFISLVFPLLLRLCSLTVLIIDTYFAQLLNQIPLVLGPLHVLLPVVVEHVQDGLVLEGSLQGLILPDEADTQQSIPLHVVDVGPGVLGLDAHNRTLHLGRGLEVVLADLDEMVDPGQQLHVDAEPAVQVGAGLGDQALSELLLEHEHSATECGLVRQQLEHEGRADLVGDVSHADVKEWQLHAHHVPGDQHELVLVLGVLEPLRQLGHHARVHLHCDYLLGPLQQQLGEVTRAGTDLQHHIGGPDRRLVHHLLQDVGVDEDVLAVSLVEDHTRAGHRLLFDHPIVDDINYIYFFLLSIIRD